MEDPTQSAVKYVKDAWLKLVNELKDLDVILDNLNVHGVFTKEEVSVVQKEKNEYEERRTLLRKITDKGEKACYKFLKTIASMCKRNSGRLSSPTKKKPDASTEDEEFDLQKWISGFSFKSEQTENYYSQGPRSCCRYQEKLKSKALKKSKKFWMGDRSLFQETYRPDLSYTPLVLDTQGGASASKIKKLKNKKCKKSRPKKLQTYLPEDDLGISPSELLKTQRDILIVGKPGIGKTALSHEILKLWAERDSRELDYMFYFDIRETSHIRDGISLEELLFSEYCEPDEDKEKVSEDIKKYSDNVTIIFDGITDLSSSVVRKIVDGDLLPYAKVIITCRPDDEEEFLPGDFLRVEVKGFNEQTIEKYFSTMLGVDQNKIFSNVELLTLCHVPLYALMVAACFLSETPEDSSQPCSMTEIYINIVRHCLQLNSKTNKKHLNSFIKEKRAELLSLAEAAFHATERKTVSLTDLQCDDSCVLSFLKPLFVQVAPTETTTSYFFLHYTVQEFFAAVWLLKNPDQIKIVFQQCLTEEGKHMKHLIPFMCRLLTKKSPSLMEYLIPVEELNNISDWFFKEMISTFFSAQCMNDEADTEDTGLDESVLFLCQCLFESQSPEACTNFLETLDYQLDLSGEILDSYLCCAVAYVVAQSKERKIQLNLEDASVSEQGMRQLYGCLNNVHWCDPLPRQLWEMVLLSEGQLSNVDLLSLDGNQMHLPVQGKRQLFKRAVSVMKNIPKRINVCLHWDNGATTVSQSLCEALLEALPFVTSLSFRMTHNSPGLEDQESDPRTLERKKKKLLLDLCLKAALDEDQSFHHVVHQLVSMFSVDKHLHNFFVDFYEHVKNKGCSSVRPKLDPLFKSAPKVWSINLSEINTSILLEVLKLLKKTKVNLTGYSDEGREVRSFLQCLPYISHLSFYGWSDSEVKFCGSLFCAAATTERELQSGENTLELLSSVCRHQTFPFTDDDYEYTRCDFFLDLYSHIKNYETKTGSSVLQPMQSFFTSDQTVWSVDLSERKTSILLEVLKLQTEKIHVELRGWSDEESEVRNFLHCLPYISKLSFSDWSDSGVKFCGSLFCAAATTERELQSGENTLELLSSVCRHQTFPFIDDDDDDDYRYTQCNFFLDLYSHIKNYETKTGSSVLQPLQSFFTSDQTVWSVDLSERKTSILLEVLKLQTEKIHVELRGWSDEESEVRNFLHCLPYISKLSFSGWSDSGVKFCGSLFCAAATTERELQSGENTLELLSSVCRHQTSPFIYHNYEYTRCDFFLDLYSHIKNYETQIGSSVLQPLQSFFISDQTEWSVDLSERKTSILLEVLKLQTEKIHVELRGWSDEESEVRNFLHCLPYISKLSCYDQEFFQCVCTSISVRSRDEAEHLVHLLQLLGFTLHLTGKLTSKTCKTVGRVLGLCGSHVDLNLTPSAMSVRGASLLFRHVKTLHSLRLSNSMALLLSGWVRRQEVPCLTVTEQLSLAPQWGPSSERVSLRVVSSLASLLRYWTIRQLDLTESSIPAQSLSSLLFHDGPLKIKLHESLSQQLLNLLCETQDDDFTSAFLRKVNGDLTPFSLNWELLHRLLQLSSQTLTVNLRKNRFLQRSITPLLPFLDRIVFKRPSPRFVLTTIREIYATRSSSVVLSFLRSFDHVISLTCREMDSDDCAALLFTLKHCDGVKLNLLWTSIPTEEIRSILCALDNVSQLSVDRNLLLKLVHCCAASGDLLTTADSLLRALQHRLDLSRSSCAELSEEGQSETLRLTVADCKAVSTVLTRSSSWDTATELHLQDCEVEDSGLDLLFSVLDRVRLRASKVILLQLVALIPLDSMRRAEYLCKALDGELDLSNTELDQGACQALACMLEFSEGLKELDLSYCQLTNQLLHTIKDHLHKVQVLDLSHNKITDASTYTLLGLISNNSSIETVRLFRNNIKHQTLLKTVKKFEIW
ncbi:uncharacterized protein LOC121520634 isoform X1 [Cheilinus undulatus]|uniref:uncharacterized protein LOC121520634 isoform X1 n=1 Tax=Cheilinus undulatus TaxID=241271 RepID=UPI001BD567BE|nr:uncharacterized protein LOC121520634 isoform X1 [Cheilinus undulatus]XP_041660117.1 uncharacterized protein LOC121520634 isoform X1 [Cheilinus undulatus]